MRYFIGIFLGLFCCISHADEPLVYAPESMKCSFVQTKTLSMLQEKTVAEGRMLFCSPAKIRWEYTDPINDLFILNGDRAAMKNESGSRTFDMKRNSFFSAIAKVMFVGLDAGYLADNKEFRHSLKQEGADSMIELLPVRSELKRTYSKIILHLRKGDNLVDRIELHEQSGDCTEIELFDIQTNIQIDETEFELP